MKEGVLKMKNYKYLVLLILSVTFLISQASKAPAKKGSISPHTTKKKGVIKAGENSNLKLELVQLESEFKSEHELIKSSYKERILSLKESQKSEIQELKKRYNKRRASIYKKYGIKPPKKDSYSNKDPYRSPKKNDSKNIKKSKTPTRK